MKCRLDPILNLSDVEERWSALETRSNTSFFLSWKWIGTWLRQIPSPVRPELLSICDQGRDIGLAIVVRRVIVRHGLIRSRAAYVNRTGDDALDEMTIEYNGIMVEGRFKNEVTIAALDFLFSMGVDEVFIDSAFRDGAPIDVRGTVWAQSARHSSNGYGVNLQDIRRSGSDYLASLHANTRSQIRRTVRAYEKLGPLCVAVAREREDAIRWYEELCRLHRQYWLRKGAQGAFSNVFLNEFHRELIDRHLTDGNIQLMRVGFGGQWVGYLYNFLFRGTVLSYQTGFDYDVLPGRNRPGVASHYAAIQYNLAAGAVYYDFLRGDNQNKVTLSTTVSLFDDLVIRRSCIKFYVEDSLRAGRRFLLSRYLDKFNQSAFSN